MSTNNNPHEQILQLLITGGFLDPGKLKEARDIIGKCAPSPGDNQSLEEAAKRYEIDFSGYPGNKCGLSEDEWQLEKIVDKIRELTTLEAIGLVRRVINANDIEMIKEIEQAVCELKEENKRLKVRVFGLTTALEKLNEGRLQEISSIQRFITTVLNRYKQ